MSDFLSGIAVGILLVVSVVLINQGRARRRVTPIAETVTAKICEMSVDFDDYTPEQRALYEGSHMFIGVHIPIRYAKHLTLSTFVNVGIDIETRGAP